MFSLGIPSSFSVKILRFDFVGLRVDLIFCCLGGGNFGAFEDLDLATLPDVPILLSNLLTACLERTVFVRAIPQA